MGGVLGAAFLLLGLHTAFWLYSMIDAKRGAEGRIGRNLSLKGMIAASLAAVLVIVYLLAVSLPEQKPYKSGAPANTRPTADRVSPKPEEPTRKVPAAEPKPVEVTPKPIVSTRESPTSTPLTPGKAGVKGASDPRQALEYMGIPYSEYAFRRAVEEGKTEAVELFLAAGMTPNGRYDSNWPTPLMKAAERGHIEVVHVLLNKGANVNTKGNYNRTALMEAAEAGHTEIVKVLLYRGAQVSAVDSSGYTALALAAKNGHTDVVELLDKARAKK